jgi:hypothetical protein
MIVAAILLAAATPSGDAIFAAAQKAAARATYPIYASYTVDVAFTSGMQRVHDAWQTVEDIRAATVLAALFSTHESANPAAPHGTDVDLQICGNVNPPDQRDPIGNVAFAIDQTFGIGPPRSYVSGSELNSPAPAAHTFRVIGGAVGPDRPYVVQLLGVVAGEHGSEYHLKLTPNFDPSRDRLRELWIATDTMTVDAAVVAGIGDRAPASKVAWNVSFVTRDGAPYLEREVALAPLDYGTQGVLSDVSIDFSDVQFAVEYPTRYPIGRQAPNALHDP